MKEVLAVGNLIKNLYKIAFISWQDNLMQHLDL